MVRLSGLQDYNNTAVSSLSFSPRSAWSMSWTDSPQRVKISIFSKTKCSRQLSGRHLQYIHITNQGYKCMCVRWLKMTFKARDRCVSDCWVASRLKSSPPASPAHFLSLFLPPLGTASCEWYTRQPKRDEKGLPFPVKRGRGEARGYTHGNVISRSSLLHPRRFLWDRDEKCDLWKMSPITRLTRLIFAADPHIL